VATADVGVAIGDLYPRFSIGRNVGYSSQKFSNLFFNEDSFQYGLGPSVSWAIFQAGRIRCNINSTEWAVNEALANYEQTLLRAFEEIENARVGFTKERERYHFLQVTIAASERSLESVLALYKNGNTDFQNVLDTQRTLFEAQNALAISEGQIVTQLINTYRALGGGWDPYHHCPDRCVRLGFANRVNADIVELLPAGNQPQQYYQAPRTQAPATQAPGTQAPGTQAPATQSGTAQPPAPQRPPELPQPNVQPATDTPPSDFRKELNDLRDSLEGQAPPNTSSYFPPRQHNLLNDVE
jgi:hypothetical protein